MVVDVPVTPVLDPLFVGGLHVIVYEPTLSTDKPNFIDEVVDDILIGGLDLPGADTIKKVQHTFYKQKFMVTEININSSGLAL